MADGWGKPYGFEDEEEEEEVDNDRCGAHRQAYTGRAQPLRALVHPQRRCPLPLPGVPLSRPRVPCDPTT